MEWSRSEGIWMIAMQRMDGEVTLLTPYNERKLFLNHHSNTSAGSCCYPEDVGSLYITSCCIVSSSCVPCGARMGW